MTNGGQNSDDEKQHPAYLILRDGVEYAPMAPVESDDQFLDRCAIAAMQGNFAAGWAHTPSDRARCAYETAEAMLAERTKRRANRAN